MYRRITALVVLALMALGLAGAWAETALTLPAGLKVIGEEAFQGLPGPGKVIFPEGIEEIGPRAFADSGITEIVLPASLKTIAKDAFQNSSLAAVTAPAGSAGYRWAVVQGYIREPLSCLISCDVQAPGTGDTACWTATPLGGTGSYRYRYELICDGASVYSGSYVSADTFSWTFDAPGSYTLVCTVSDGDGTASVEHALTVIDANALTLTGIDVATSRYLSLQTHTWTANAAGGTPPYSYAFELYEGTRKLANQNTASPTYSYTFSAAAACTLKVTVTDAAGASASMSIDFDADPVDSPVNAVVRIYLHCDSKGNVYRDLDHPGHYELMLDNGSEGITFDGHVFDQPVFSFNSAGTSTAGMVTIYDSSTMPWTGAQLYTFSFTTQGSKVLELLDKILTGTWLNTSAETATAGGYKYPVVERTHKTYKISSANCFTAVSAWTKVLGYGTLSSIAQSASSYADYTAWKMYDKYKNYWTYQGQV